METSEIDGSHIIPRDIQTFADKLQQVIYYVGGRIISNIIKPSSAQRYSHILIQRLNINEEVTEGQKLRMRTGQIKVLVLSHKRVNQSDTRLS